MSAYLSFVTEPWINGKDNRFSVNGGASTGLYSAGCLYKIPSGATCVTVTSGNGESWEVEVNLREDDQLTIKCEVPQKDIVDVMYKVGPVHPFGKFAAVRL